MVWSENQIRRSYQVKYATKATKRQLLEHVSSTRGASIVTVCGNFGLSESGARCKLWRLTKQGLIEPIPENVCREKAWQLTRAGRRHLDFLRSSEQLLGGTKARRSDLEAEIARLKAENNQWKRTAGVKVQQVALTRGANQSLGAICTAHLPRTNEEGADTSRPLLRYCGEGWPSAAVATENVPAFPLHL